MWCWWWSSLMNVLSGEWPTPSERILSSVEFCRHPMLYPILNLIKEDKQIVLTDDCIFMLWFEFLKCYLVFFSCMFKMRKLVACLCLINGTCKISLEKNFPWCLLWCFQLMENLIASQLCSKICKKKQKQKEIAPAYWWVVSRYSSLAFSQSCKFAWLRAWEDCTILWKSLTFTLYVLYIKL